MKTLIATLAIVFVLVVPSFATEHQRFQAAQTGSVRNVSSLGFVKADISYTVGIVVEGGMRQVFIRALGPSLDKFNLKQASPSPHFQVYDKTGILIYNSTITQTTADPVLLSEYIRLNGGFPIDASLGEPITSILLAEGSYTIVCGDTSSTGGYVLCEAYFGAIVPEPPPGGHPNI